MINHLGVELMHENTNRRVTRQKPKAKVTDNDTTLQNFLLSILAFDQHHGNVLLSVPLSYLFEEFSAKCSSKRYGINQHIVLKNKMNTGVRHELKYRA